MPTARGQRLSARASAPKAARRAKSEARRPPRARPVLESRAGMQPFDTEARVVAVVAHPLPYYTIALEGPAEWAAARAGQFVMIASRPESEAALEPYLRRAFSIHDVSKTDRGARIELLAKTVGPGTRALASRREGERLAVL